MLACHSSLVSLASQASISKSKIAGGSILPKSARPYSPDSRRETTDFLKAQQARGGYKINAITFFYKGNEMSSEKLTEQLVDIALGYQFSSFPEEVLSMAKFAMLDHVGLAIRGASEDLTRIISQEVLGRELSGLDFIPGKMIDAYLPNVAMLRASSSHAIDYDDTFPAAQAAHTSASVVGSVLTLGNELGSSGKDLLTAIIAGFEVAGRVGALLHGDHYLKGFHPTGTVGVFGVAAACGRLLKLDKQQMLVALGLAATQASGVKSTFGTMAKPFNAGKAAYNGMLAARLASNNFTANHDALEADKGYLDMFIGLPEPERKVVPAEEFLILGNVFKFHAACHATHPVIEATRQLMDEHGFSANDVKEMNIEVATLGLKTASIDIPQSGLDCKFSFAQVAAFVLCGIDTAADETYTDEILAHELVNQTRAKVSKIENTSISPLETTVRISLNDGKNYERYFNYQESMASLENIKPGLQQKFIVCTESTLGTGLANKLMEMILALEDLDQGLQSFQ